MSRDSWLFDAPGPRAKRRALLGSVVGVAVLVGAAIWLLYALYAHGQLDSAIWSSWAQSDVQNLVWQGLLATLAAAGMSIVLSFALGGVLTFMRLSGRRVLRWIARGWIEFFRGIPTLLAIFFTYLGLPVLGVQISIYWALVLGVTLYGGALFSEIFRAGIEAVPVGQKEAAKALGIGGFQTLMSIVMPQGFRWMLPLLISQAVMILKETSLGFVIGYTELLRNGRLIIEDLGNLYALPIYTLMGATYVVINLLLSGLAHWAERRSRRGLSHKRAAEQEEEQEMLLLDV